jgi:hypothetical protein
VVQHHLYGSKWVCLCNCGKRTTPQAIDLIQGKSKSCGCASRTDLVGQRFGRLLVLARSTPFEARNWRCQCDCGRITEVFPGNLGQTKSCGCLKAEREEKAWRDIAGQRFCRLLALERVPAKGPPRWRCRCDCGAEVVVQTRRLLNGDVKSCKCLQREILQERNSRGHGLKRAQLQLYRAWSDMKGRCLRTTHASYHNYGGRGITIYPAWVHDPKAYIGYIEEKLGPRPSPKHSIDRIANDRGYEPANLRWATPSQQLENRRTTKTVAAGGRN